MNKFPPQLLLLILLVLTNIFINVRAEESTSNKNPQRSTSIIEAIISLFKSPERRFISRGDEVCLISPGNRGEQIIWSDRPLFILQGEVPESEINLIKSAESLLKEEQLVWKETVIPDTQTIAYTGDDLQPGVTYDWELVSDDATDLQINTFTLMEQSQREAIAAELAALENKLENDGATKEDIAIAKADYFVRQKLGYDALQQLYSVSNPSPRLTDQITAIEQHLCDLNE